MRIAGQHFAVALTVAMVVNVALVVGFVQPSEGENMQTLGPKIDFDVTAGGILGAAVEPTEVAEDETSEDPVREEKQVEDEIKPETTEIQQAKLEETELLEAVPEPARDDVRPVTEDSNTNEAVTAEPEVEVVPSTDPIKQTDEQKPKKKKVTKPEKKKTKSRETKPVNKKGPSRKRAKSGSSSQGAAGRGKGGGGKARASAGAISSYKSRVNARMASCVRRRIAGRGRGRVTIRFSVTSGGSISGVGVSGTAALRGVAGSAARGCSMPRPPSGSGRLRFAFPVTVR